jgi:opacity protein-like surface antigen
MQRSFAVLGLALLVAVPAVAAERGFYAGLDAGQYAYDLDTNGASRQITDGLADLGLTTSNPSSDTSEDGFTYGVVIGYQLLPYLAFEAAWVDLGNAEYKYGATVSDGTTSADVRASATVDSAGPTLSALGILPFGKGWEAYARVGGYYGSNDTKLRVTVGSIEQSASDDSSSTSFVWGGGIGYTRQLYTVRLDYQLFTDVGDDGAEGDIDRIALVAIKRF